MSIKTEDFKKNEHSKISVWENQICESHISFETFNKARILLEKSLMYVRDDELIDEITNFLRS